MTGTNNRNSELRWLDLAISILISASLIGIYNQIFSWSILTGIILLPFLFYNGLLVSSVVMWFTPIYALSFTLTVLILAIAVWITTSVRRRSTRLPLLIASFLTYAFSSVLLLRFLPTIN